MVRTQCVALLAFATLTLLCRGAAAQVSIPATRPLVPVQSRPGLVPPAPVFANIQVSIAGPDSVQIQWAPYPQGFDYQLKRNGIAINEFTANPNETRMATALDNSAPQGVNVSYSVVVKYHGEKFQNAQTNTTILGDGSKESNVVTIFVPLVGTVTQLPAAPFRLQLQGFVDLHAHPMSYLGFGGKLIYGAVDDQVLRPPLNFPCINTGALTDEDEIYGPPLIGPPFPGAVPSPCGNGLRFGLVQAIETPFILGSAPYAPAQFVHSGPPLFPTWPAWNDLLRQKMWWQWIFRSYQGGQRVMVALAVNSKLLADVALGAENGCDASQVLNTKGSELCDDDLHSADIQISELVHFVSLHQDFMNIVHSSAELYDTVLNQKKMAIVMGVEIDNIGNLHGNVPHQVINAAIDHLYAEGVRYIFPVHLVNNPIGKTAAYQDMFMIANTYEGNGVMNFMCVQNQGITYQYSQASSVASAILGEIQMGKLFPVSPPVAVVCSQGAGNINGGDIDPATGRLIVDSLGRPVGLSAEGALAIQHMMDLGMLIDVDHMSGASVDGTLDLATHNSPVPYPLFSGHNNLRGSSAGASTERQLTAVQYQRLFALHGMAGIGGAKSNSAQWSGSLLLTLSQGNAPNVPVAFGTDADGMEFMMSPRPNSNVNLATARLPAPAIFPLPPAITNARLWDYNHEGVAHYGLLPDFLMDLQSIPGGTAIVNQMFKGAQYFYDTWALAERDKRAP